MKLADIHPKTLILALAAGALLAVNAYPAEPAREDPAAIAATLDKQAADYRATAAKHEHMAKMHRGGAGSPKLDHEGIAKHCEQLAKDLRSAAKESEELAEEYRKEAGK
ncbi:MAG TPA: hypothetical protein VFL16_16490 [Steroidobacteraceae bacterium]|nr:hypothetical protein [Steroidobacteraceae bacterium]